VDVCLLLRRGRKYRGIAGNQSKKDAERKFKKFEKELAAKIAAWEDAQRERDHMEWLKAITRACGQC